MSTGQLQAVLFIVSVDQPDPLKPRCAGFQQIKHSMRRYKREFFIGGGQATNLDIAPLKEHSLDRKSFKGLIKNVHDRALSRDNEQLQCTSTLILPNPLSNINAPRSILGPWPGMRYASS